jgi:hypothetical protein
MKKELEPAFARPHSEDSDFVHHAQAGMTLRDYFAAKAMQAFLMKPSSITCPDEIIAQDAYNTADAMMKAREA